MKILSTIKDINTPNGLSRLQLNRWLPALLVSATLIILSWQFYVGIESINEAGSPARTAPKTAMMNTAITDIPPYASLLFGTPTKSQKTMQKVLPNTQLALILRAAFTATSPDKGSAIIENSGDNKSRSYKVGSTITGQTKLQAVHANRVVLSSNGKLETLYFPKPSVSAKLASSVNRTTPSSNATMTEDERKTLIRQRLQDLRNRVKNQKS